MHRAAGQSREGERLRGTGPGVRKSNEQEEMLNLKGNMRKIE